MPTACAKVEKQNSIESTEPFKQVQVLVEKKIRNLEKRKAKLEQLKQDQDSGKELHDDQKKAIKRFEEVIELLDFFKEFNKSIATIFTDHAKLVKKQAKKEQLERQQQDVDRFRNVILFQDLLNKLGNAKVRSDFLTGSNGALQLNETQLNNLDEVRKSVIPDVTTINVPTAKDLENYGERLSALVDGKSRDALNGVTYKEMKELLTKISECDYFTKSVGSISDVTGQQTVTEKEETTEKASECVENSTTSNEKYPTETTGINERLTTTVPPESQSTLYNVMPTTRYERDQPDPAVIAMAPAYQSYPCVQTSTDALAHGINLTAAPTSQKVNFEDVNTHQPIPTQTFTNQNYNYPPQIPQPASIAVGTIPVPALPVQNVSPHQIHTTSPTQMMTSEQAQTNQTTQFISQAPHSMNNYAEQFGNFQMEGGHVENSNLTSHESDVNAFGNDEHTTFSQNQHTSHGQHQRREGGGYRGRGGGMRGGPRGAMNGYNKGTGSGRGGGHKGFGNSYGNNGSNGSYYNDKRPNYGHRGAIQHKPGGRGAPGGNRNQTNFGYQGKPHPQMPQQQQQQQQQQ